MRVLIDLQPLQIPGCADRGVGRYTNGLLKALTNAYDVTGLRVPAPFLVPPSATVPALELSSHATIDEVGREVAAGRFDIVLNTTGPFWPALMASNIETEQSLIIGSIFYDAIPWVFSHVYLTSDSRRRDYHNRCVDLYARADLVCAISQHSLSDALRFGYATAETGVAISTGVDPLPVEAKSAHETWGIRKPYLLSVSGDDFRKNPEALIGAFLCSSVHHSYDLVIVVSNGAETGFIRSMRDKYGDLALKGIVILSQVTDAQLGSLYRDSEVFVCPSIYEGMGIPLVEAMHVGKWIVASRQSSLAEVAGKALLVELQDPQDTIAVAACLDELGRRLGQGDLDPEVPRHQARLFTWTRVIERFQEALEARRSGPRRQRPPRRPRLFWASPFPSDQSGIAFYSDELVDEVGRRYDIVLIPDRVSTFSPTSRTGRFKIVEPDAGSILEMCDGQDPTVFYNMGNSHFHLRLVDLLFQLPGVVLLHDTFLGGMEALWRQQTAGVEAPIRPRLRVTPRLKRLAKKLAKVDALLLPGRQPTLLRRRLGRIARLPGVALAVLRAAQVLRAIAASGDGSSITNKHRKLWNQRPLVGQIIVKSHAVLVLAEHAKSLIPPAYLQGIRTHVVPLYARYRGPVSADTRTQLRQKYGVPADAFVVTTTGFQASIKMTDRFVDSCAELSQLEGAAVYVQVVGEFVERSFETSVRALHSQHGLGGFISAGFVDEETLRERVALSDAVVFLRNASTGGPSAGLNDALGMGIPALVTDDFAFREYPKNAVLHVSNDEITEGLILLYRYPEVRAALSQGALDYARDHSRDRIADTLSKVLGMYARGAREPVGRENRPLVLVDLTLGVLQRVRSGLQRVEREIAAVLRELDPGEEIFTFVAWDALTRQFHRITLEDLTAERDTAAKSWLSDRPPAPVSSAARLFALSLNWPLGGDYFAYLLSLVLGGIELSVLLPDLIPLRHRWNLYANHPVGSGIDLFATFCAEVVPACTNVFTISHYARIDIEKALSEVRGATHRSPQLHVLKLGADWSFPFLDHGRPEQPGRLIASPYLLYVSSLDVRKNHGRLLKAMELVRRQGVKLDLVLVGRVDGSMPGEVLDGVRETPWVHHFEGVDDTVLRHLYQSCLFTVYPSLDEGFGLPVVESFKYGKFCLASNAGAIPEAGGDFADYFDPEDVDTLAEKILHYTRDRETLERRTALLASYRPISWRDTTRQIVEVIAPEHLPELFDEVREGRRPDRPL